MNQPASLYSKTSSNATCCGNIYLSTSTGNDPRQGWRTPLNNIIYSEQRDEETGYNYHGARYYDAALLTSWLSVDPLADKYLGMSPYNYCVNNPVKLVDEDGEDARVKVLEKDGKKQIRIQSTVYLQSTEYKKKDLARLAKNYTNAAKRKLKSMDVEGGSVSFDISFKVLEDNTILSPGDNILVLNPNNKVERSGVPCVKTTENGVLIEETCGGLGDINADNLRPGAVMGVLHETLHLLGLSDRYTGLSDSMEGYEKDIMGGNPAYAKSLNMRHYQNYINYINKHPELIDDNGNGVLKHKVDIEDFK